MVDTKSDTTKNNFDEEEITTSPRVSVLVFVYQNDPNLIDCMRTLHNQILDDMEIIVLVHYQDVRSQEIINDYSKRDSRFRMI